MSIPLTLTVPQAETDRLSVQFEVDLSRATGASETRDDFISKLSRIVQLTGELPSRCPRERPLTVTLEQVSRIQFTPKRS